MKIIIAALHGILTGQTDASWPDKFDAWMYRRDPEAKVLKKEYLAGPFPRWNCWVKDPLLAHSLANELELFLERTPGASNPPPALWFVAHSNGAVVALLTSKRLLARGYRVGGLVLTGAACEAELSRNKVLDWLRQGMLGAAVAYSSADDAVLGSPFRLRWLWSKLLWPYGTLGRTGWLLDGKPLGDAPTPVALSSAGNLNPAMRTAVVTRWFQGGHSVYFTAEHIDRSFELIYQDIISHSAAGFVNRGGDGSAPCPENSKSDPGTSRPRPASVEEAPVAANLAFGALVEFSQAFGRVFGWTTWLGRMRARLSSASSMAVLRALLFLAGKSFKRRR